MNIQTTLDKEVWQYIPTFEDPRIYKTTSPKEYGMIPKNKRRK